jgi:hypothetical protein
MFVPSHWREETASLPQTRPHGARHAPERHFSVRQLLKGENFVQSRQNAGLLFAQSNPPD